MCNGIVIDAHVIKHLTPELVNKSGAVYSLISWITSNCGIAISDRIRTHWEKHCGSRERNTHFWEWYTTELLTKRTIHPIPVQRFSGNDWTKLMARYRIPDDIFIRAVIECANSTSEPRYILADDILLHDPVAKTTATATQLKTKEERTGSLCQYLERELSIILGIANHCREYFEMDQGTCQANSQNCNVLCPRTSRS